MIKNEFKLISYSETTIRVGLQNDKTIYVCSNETKTKLHIIYYYCIIY